MTEEQKQQLEALYMKKREAEKTLYCHMVRNTSSNPKEQSQRDLEYMYAERSCRDAAKAYEEALKEVGLK